MAWRITHVAAAPPGWRVRTVHSGAHELRVAFPPGRRRRGSGKLIEILHPAAEKNCGCRARNPGALVIFGNPEKPNPGELVIFGNEPRAQKIRQGRERAEKIREARREFRGNDEVSETEQAVKLYQDFHGVDPDAIVAAQRSAAMRLDYTALGPLVGLGLFVEGAKIPTPDHWDIYAGAVDTHDGQIMLAANAAGTQLYAIGGEQAEFERVAEQLGEDLSKDILDLGPLAFVVYLDRKPGDGQSVEYMHKFDEPRPALGYDRLKREIFFAGGAYKIEGLWLHH